MANFIKNTDFDDKLKHLNKKVTSDKTNHVEAEQKITDLTNQSCANMKKKKKKDYLLGRMYFTGSDGCQNFLVFAPMLSSLILDRNGKLNNWISTGISFAKIKLFDAGLEPTMFNLANGRVNLKFNNSFLVRQSFFSLYSNFILN